MDNGKTNWQNYLKKLSKDVQITERSLGHDDEENQKERRDQMKAREDYFTKTQRRLQSFKTGLNGIKDCLDDICHAKVGAEVIQPMLEIFEKKLTDYKIIMRDDFADLENEENSLMRDVQLAGGRIEEMLTANDGAIKADEVDRVADMKQKKIASDKRFNLELERQAKIGSIDKQLISMGGRTGGWDYRDQDAFIKVWTQAGCSPVMIHDKSSGSNRDDNENNEYKRETNHAEEKGYEINNNHFEDDADEESHIVSRDGDLAESKSHQINPENKAKIKIDDVQMEKLALPKGQIAGLLRRLPVAVPGKSHEELEEHITWYLKLLTLTAAKKRLLLNWKEEKLTQERANEMALAHIVTGGDRQDGVDMSIDEIRREAIAEIEERANARLKVSAWREKKEKDKETKLSKEKDSAAYEIKLREDELKRRQSTARVQLDEWREAESLSQAALKKVADEASKLARRAVSVDPAEVRRRQQRDVEDTKERNKQKAAYNKQNRPRSVIISELNAATEFTAKRDPTRLTAPTKTSSSRALSGEYLDDAERKRATVGAHSANIAMSGRDLQYSGRTVPMWRKPPT